MADFSNVVALIPVRSLSGSKSRLGEPLDAEERASLVLGLMRRSVRAALAAERVASVAVVSTDREILDEARHLGARPIFQRTEGLNEGLAEGRAVIAPDASAILVLPADLPDVGAASIDRFVGSASSAAAASAASASAASSSGGGIVALVPDRHGTGTNALLVSPPDLIEFCFGEGSRRDHANAAARAGATYLEMNGPLSFDVDTPEDLLLADLRGLDHEAGR